MNALVTQTFRLLITGSRDWGDATVIREALDYALHRAQGRTLIVVHGACPSGADHHAERLAQWLRSKGLPVDVERHPADWKRHGRGAGPIRNQYMVSLGADLCGAFIRNDSRGATGCANLAEAAGIPTRRWTELPPPSRQPAAAQRPQSDHTCRPRDAGSR